MKSVLFWEAGQLIVVAEECEPFLGVAALGDVLADAVHADDRPVLVAAHGVPPEDHLVAAGPRAQPLL